MSEPVPERPTPPDDTEGPREQTAEELTSPEIVGPANAAVYEVIRRWPGSAERNAVIWRAVEAYRAVLVEPPGDDLLPRLPRQPRRRPARRCDSRTGALPGGRSEPAAYRAE